MNIEFYRMCCNSCAVGTYHIIKAEKVQITLDLETNQYIFEAVCPICGNKLLSARRI